MPTWKSLGNRTVPCIGYSYTTDSDGYIIDKNSAVTIAKDKQIFAGNTYKGVLRQVISSIKLINLEIHLYPDSDVSIEVINDFINYVRPYKYHVYIHRNTIGKDMGENIDKIKESIEKVI